ncbi:hypothetical protein [Intestinibacter sp.]|uniref:hypothetical protein n=1 Tax=Intestinibacter sp. TaxID=1965304 RepID=UPI002A764A30|nr:hypothetical protein [Intestinibacter sp.]MDY2736055.1 hypothetical protein [Intestinibacter sp.]
MSDNYNVVELAKEVVLQIKKDQKDRKLHNTKLLLKNYKLLKKHLEEINTIGYKDYFKEDDLYKIDESDVFIESVLKTKVRTAQMLASIDIALDILKEEYTAKSKYAIYDAFYMYYIENKTYTDVANTYYCGTSTAKRWANEGLNRFNVLMWGVDALGV